MLIFRPRADRVLIDPIDTSKEHLSAGGIVLPETIKDTMLVGRVLAIGEGRYLPGLDGNWKLMPLRTKVGAVVAYNQYAGRTIKIEGRDLKLLKEDEIDGELEGLDDSPNQVGMSAQEIGKVRKVTR